MLEPEFQHSCGGTAGSECKFVDESVDFKKEKDEVLERRAKSDQNAAQRCGIGFMLFYIVPLPAATQSAIRYIVPLGCRCCTASFFEKFKIRKFAGPFDWMFSCPRIVAHCLQDEFKSFLNPSLYVFKDYRFDSIGPEGEFLPKPRRRNLIGHQLYSDWMCGVGHGTLFNHRDPLYEEDDYKYMTRAVERFQRILESGDRKLFAILNFDAELWVNDDIQDVFKCLLAKTSNFDLVAVNCLMNQGDVSAPSPFQMTVYGDARLLQIHLSCSGNSTGKDFSDELDICRVKRLLIDPYHFELAEDPLKKSPSHPHTASTYPSTMPADPSGVATPLHPKTVATNPSIKPAPSSGSPSFSLHTQAICSAVYARKRTPSCSKKRKKKRRRQTNSIALAKT